MPMIKNKDIYFFLKLLNVPYEIVLICFNNVLFGEYTQIN